MALANERGSRHERFQYGLDAPMGFNLMQFRLGYGVIGNSNKSLDRRAFDRVGLKRAPYAGLGRRFER